MTERLSRKALYDLAWSEPLRTLSRRFGISAVALKNTCARAKIPTPDRGYWAKKESGKIVFQTTLPVRPPGMDEEVVVGKSDEEQIDEIVGPLPPPPEFPEPIQAVRDRIALTVGYVSVPKVVRVWHTAVERVLKDEERRREKQRTDLFALSWRGPRFDAPFNPRRLRILNALLTATARMNGKASIHGSFYWSRVDSKEMEIDLTFHETRIPFSLNPIKPSRHSRARVSPSGPDATRLELAISPYCRPEGRQAV